MLSNIYAVGLSFSKGQIFQNFQVDPLITEEKLIGDVVFHICHIFAAGQTSQGEFRKLGQHPVLGF